MLVASYLFKQNLQGLRHAKPCRKHHSGLRPSKDPRYRTQCLNAACGLQFDDEQSVTCFYRLRCILLPFIPVKLEQVTDLASGWP